MERSFLMVNILFEFRQKYRVLFFAMLVPAAFMWISCAEDLPQESLAPQVQTVFDPSTGEVPFPNDVLYSMSVEVDGEGNVIENGHVNLPVPEEPTQKALFETLNTLNGFSNYTPASVGLMTVGDDAVNPATINKESVILIGVDRDYFAQIVAGMSQGKTIEEITDRDLNDPDDVLGLLLDLNPSLPNDIAYLPAINETTGALDINFLAPLQERWQYIAVVISGKDADGNPVGLQDTSAEGNPINPAPFFYFLRQQNPLCVDKRSTTGLLDNESACAAEALRGIYNGILPILEKTDTISLGSMELPSIKRENVAMLWTFKTETATAPLLSLRTAIAANMVPIPSSVTAAQSEAAPSAVFDGFSDLDANAVAWKGTLTAPNFLMNETPDGMKTFKPDSESALGVAVEPEAIPFAMIAPKIDATACAADAAECLQGIIIAGHGLGQDKTIVAQVAAEAIAAKLAVVGIDAPFHGERVVMVGDKPVPFLSPNLFATRDNIRQAVLEWVQLINSVINFDDGIGSLLLGKLPIVDQAPVIAHVGFVGSSLSGIMGGVLAGVEDRILDYVLAAPGAAWPKILLETEDPGTRDPLIAALASMGLVEGTPEFIQFMGIAGWVLEQADPIMFVGHTIEKNKRFTTPGTTMRQKGRSILVQMMQDDPVVVNDTTKILLSAAVGGEDPTSDDSHFTPMTGATDYIAAKFDPDNDGSHQGDDGVLYFVTWPKNQGDEFGKHSFISNVDSTSPYYATGQKSRQMMVDFIMSDGSAISQ